MKHADQVIEVPKGKTVHITIKGCAPGCIDGPVTLEINTTGEDFVKEDRSWLVYPTEVS